MSAISNISEPWNGHSNQEVEDFIKEELGSVGAIIIGGTAAGTTFTPSTTQDLNELVNYFLNGKPIIFNHHGANEEYYYKVIGAYTSRGKYLYAYDYENNKMLRMG